MAEQRRNSRQRTLVYDAVKASHEHPNAEEVYLTVKEQLPEISLGTVYRNLNILEEMGLLRRIHTGIGGDRFDAMTTMHPHLICTQCGGVFDLPCDVGRETELLKATFAQVGAQVQEVQIRAWGICRSCQKEESK